MESSEGISPDTITNQIKETKISLDQKYSDSLGIETAIIFNKDNKNPDTVRVYRGVHGLFNKNVLDEQTSNMMRFIDPNRDIKINKEIAEDVENLAANPTIENYKMVFDKSKQLGLNNFMIENPLEFYEDFKSNLVTQHRNAIRNDTGSSPWVATTTDPVESFNSTGIGFGSILVIDIPKNRITLDKHADENEILINGYIKKEEISAVLLVDTTKVTKSSTREEKSIELTNLIKELSN